MTPKYITINGRRHVVVDGAQRKLDAARKRHARAWNRGYLAEQAGRDGQTILDRANAELAKAEAEYARARGGE